MSEFPEPLEALIQELGRLPGVGPKTAQRLALHLLKVDRQRVERLARALIEVRDRLGRCTRCYNIAEGELCTICASPRREDEVVCVVESPTDLIAIERSAEYRGRYHVLHGVLSPLEGVGPEDLHIPQLVERIRGGAVREVIVATNADVEGEATAVYIQRSLSDLGVLVTRPARGLPVGADLEYADDRTVARALLGRRGL